MSKRKFGWDPVALENKDKATKETIKDRLEQTTGLMMLMLSHREDKKWWTESEIRHIEETIQKNLAIGD